MLGFLQHNKAFLYRITIYNQSYTIGQHWIPLPVSFTRYGVVLLQYTCWIPLASLDLGWSLYKIIVVSHLLQGSNWGGGPLSL